MERPSISTKTSASPKGKKSKSKSRLSNRKRGRPDLHQDGDQAALVRPQAYWLIRGRRKMTASWKKSTRTANEKVGARSLNELSPGHEYPFRSFPPALGGGSPLFPVFGTPVYIQRCSGRI